MFPGGGYMTEPPPGALETPKGLGDVSATQYSSAVDMAQNFPITSQPITSALGILRANPNLETGPGQQQWQTWQGFFRGFGFQLRDMTGDNLKDWQELSKYLAQILRDQPGANHTDLARLNDAASNPHADQARPAIQELLARMLGQQRFQVARLQYFQSLHPGEDLDAYARDFRRETNKWAAQQDTVAWSTDYMEPAQIRNYMKGLTKQGYEKFQNSAEEALRLSGIQPPAYAPAGG